jgi:hypothetical protein
LRGPDHAARQAGLSFLASRKKFQHQLLSSAAPLNSQGRQVTKDVIDPTQEDQTMTYRVTLIPFDLVFRNDYPCANIAVGSAQRDVVTRVGDDCDVPI